VDAPARCAGVVPSSRAVDPIRVVVILEFDKLACQVRSIPEEYPIKILAPDRSDPPFDKRMRDRDIWHRLDLLDLQKAQVGEPAVKAKQRIVVGTQVLRFGLASSSVVEHSADPDAINVGRGDAKADDAASEDVHDQQHSMAAQQDGFNPEQIGAPEAVLEVANECQPDGPQDGPLAPGAGRKCFASTRRTTSLSISMPKA